MYMKKNIFFYIASLVSLFFITSCTQGIPEILSLSTQVIKVQQEDLTFTEQLSVFVFFTDSDGTQDFASISLCHNDTGLTWTIDKEDAVVRLRGKDRWIGSSVLVGPGGGAIPSGTYTLVVSDLAGNEAVSIISIIRPVFPEQVPCKFFVENEKWVIERNSEFSGFSKFFLFLLDDSNKLLYSWAVPSSSKNEIDGTLSSLRSLAPKATRVQCLVENASSTADRKSVV